MKVILQKNVPDLGDIGDIKEVADGYARNFLLPRKLVIAASSGSTRAALHQKKLVEKKLAQRHLEMQTLSEKMGGIGVCEVPVRVGANKKLFGSVTAQQISVILRERGFGIDKRKIEMGERIRTLGEYTVKVKLAENITVPLKISVVADAESQAVAEEEEAAPVQAEQSTPEIADTVEPTEAKVESTEVTAEAENSPSETKSADGE